VRLKNIRRYTRHWQRFATSTLAIVAVTSVGSQLQFNTATVVMLYLLVVVWQSLSGRFVPAAAISLMAAGCFDYFFLPPPNTLRIAGPLNILAFVVFLVIAHIVSLTVTRLVTRLRSESDRVKRRGNNLEQLYRVAQRLLLLKPTDSDGVPLLQVFRDGFGASAICLFNAATGELYEDGVSHRNLAEWTRQAYVAGEDDDQTAGVSIRCLKVGRATTGAIGFEDLPDPEWTAGPLAILAATAMEQAKAFRRASYQAAATQAEVFRTAILDALGHEFKTPLATILAVVGGLRESQLETGQRELAGIIESEVSRLNNLADRLLRTARLDRDEVKLRVENTDIAALVERVMQRYTAQPRDRYAAIQNQCQPAEAPADIQLLDLALTQLVDNAFKYSVAGSTVTATIGADRDYLTVRVRNEGSSIASQERDLIFERFYRGSAVRNLVSGAGLGLYVARKIAVAHGGTLDLDNTAPPRAVVFCLKLPLLCSNGNHHVNTSN
jgi:two-component system, OmpR family, sensor histidine kinase KdpD